MPCLNGVADVKVLNLNPQMKNESLYHYEVQVEGFDEASDEVR